MTSVERAYWRQFAVAVRHADQQRRELVRWATRTRRQIKPVLRWLSTCRN